MITTRLSRMAAIALLALGLAGCVAYQEPAPYYAPTSYYAPAPAYYYGPAPVYGPSVNFEFRGGDHDGRHGHWR